jgi:hypothetical protein
MRCGLAEMPNLLFPLPAARLIIADEPPDIPYTLYIDTNNRI